MHENGALVLFSGGLGSTTVLAMTKVMGHDPIHTLSIHYGQRHDASIHDAVPYQAMLERFGVNVAHLVETPSLGSQTSSLTDPEKQVPKGANPRRPGVPNTYVPGRNLLFLSRAVSIAQEEGLPHIYAGMSQVDYSGYPDCRGEFLTAFEAAARLGTDWPELRIHAPLLDMPKADIIRWGLAHGVDYSLTASCYDPQNTAHDEDLACGTCDACQLRLEAWRGVGQVDPIQYLPPC